MADDGVASLIYGYLTEKCKDVAESFRKKFRVTAPPPGSPSIEDLLAHFRSSTPLKRGRVDSPIKVVKKSKISEELSSSSEHPFAELNGKKLLASETGTNIRKLPIMLKTSKGEAVSGKKWTANSDVTGSVKPSLGKRKKTSSSSDESDSMDKMKIKPLMTPTTMRISKPPLAKTKNSPVNLTPVKAMKGMLKVNKEDVLSSTSSDSEDIKEPSKMQTKSISVTKRKETPILTKTDSSSSSSNSSDTDDDMEVLSGKQVKPVPVKTMNEKHILAKKTASSSSDSSDSDDDGDDVNKVLSNLKAKSAPINVMKKKLPITKEDSSSSSDYSETDDDKKALSKTPIKCTTGKVMKGMPKVTKKDSSSNLDVSYVGNKKSFQSKVVKSSTVKAMKETPVLIKKDSSSSDSDSSDSDNDKKPPQNIIHKSPLVKAVKEKSLVAKKDSSSSSCSSDSEGDKSCKKKLSITKTMGTPVITKKVASSDVTVRATVKAMKETPVLIKKESSSSDSDSSDSDNDKKLPQNIIRKSPLVKAIKEKSLVAKKDSSSSSCSSDSEGDKSCKKKLSITKTMGTPVIAKKVASSDLDSSDSENELPQKPSVKTSSAKPDITNKADKIIKKASVTSSSSESSDSETNEKTASVKTLPVSASSCSSLNATKNENPQFSKKDELNGVSKQEWKQQKLVIKNRPNSGVKEPFRRVKEDEIEVDQRFGNNSFEAKSGEWKEDSSTVGFNEGTQGWVSGNQGLWSNGGVEFRGGGGGRDRFRGLGFAGRGSFRRGAGNIRDKFHGNRGGVFNGGQSGYRDRDRGSRGMSYGSRGGFDSNRRYQKQDVHQESVIGAQGDLHGTNRFQKPTFEISGGSGSQNKKITFD